MQFLKNASRIALMACVACVLAMALGSCGTATQQKDAAQLNREYMSSVNRISNEASEDLATFTEAASQGDVAAMRIAADNATETLSKIGELTVPDTLKEVGEEYKAGVADLSKALEDYVELYASVANDTQSDASSADGETGDGALASIDKKALEEVQETYQSGIDHLSKADSLVAQIAGSGQDTQEGDQASQGAQAGQTSQANQQS